MYNNSKIEVLLVDDEESSVRGLITGLERQGINVVYKANPQDALRLINDNPERFDVIIMDQVFLAGDMDGIKATKQIKAQWPNLDVIVLTGYAEMDKGIEALRAGAYDYLVKPPDHLELETHIRYAAERKRLIITAAEKERLSKAIEEMGDEIIVIDRDCNNVRKHPIDEYDLPTMAFLGRYLAKAFWNAQAHVKLQLAEQRERERETLRGFLTKNYSKK